MQVLFKNKPAFVEIDPCKILYNVGGLMDIPTGKYVRGLKGENILNGGLSVFTAIMGKGNTYKSKLARFLILSAADKVASSGIFPYINTYDTEVNIDRNHLIELSHKFNSFKDIDLCDEGIWSITDKTHHLGNEWFKILKDFLKNEKVKNKKDYLFETPICDKNGKPIYTIFPSFGDVDSISEFATSDVEEIQDKNELGDSGGNTIHMRSGLAKTRLIMEIPGICNQSSHYMVMTAHLGKDIPIQQGPYSVPVKLLPHMRPGEAVKGVAGKFLFLTNLLWQTVSSSTFNNQTTKGPEYPKTREMVDTGSTDLNLVTIKQIRSKSGPSGFTIELIISQSEGVLPTLSEFHYIKENDRYGIEGSRDTYNLILYPSVKIGRTTVREKIDTDPMLCRAIKITADLLQIKTFYKTLPFEIPTVKELYEKIAKDYDWNVLLQTRDYWTFKNYENPVNFLSTMDLLEMYHGLYTPWWYQEKTKKEK